MNRCNQNRPYAGSTAWNHVLVGGQDQTNPFASSRGDITAMQPFVKLLWTLVQLKHKWT